MYSPASGRACCGRRARRAAVCQVAATMNEPSRRQVSSPSTPLGSRASSSPPSSRTWLMVKVDGGVVGGGDGGEGVRRGRLGFGAGGAARRREQHKSALFYGIASVLLVD